MPSEGPPRLEGPVLDKELEDFRAAHGNGWVTRAPVGKGSILVHLKEADWETYRRTFRTMRIYLGYLGDSPQMPTNVASCGILFMATFKNESDAPFVWDWEGKSRTFDMLLLMAHDLETAWYPSFNPVQFLDKRVDQEIKTLMWPRLEVAPGRTVEKLLLFKPREEPNRTVLGSHVAMVFMARPAPKNDMITEGTAVLFPFLNPKRAIPNSVVELKLAPGPVEEFVLPSMQPIRGRGGTWVTEGFVRFKDEGAVKAYFSKPGDVKDVPPDSVWKVQSYPTGYKVPKGLTLTNPKAPSVGKEPEGYHGWAPYSFREEEAAKATWLALPLKEKIAKATALLACEDPENRYEGITIVGNFANEGYLDIAVKVFQDPDPDVAKRARWAYGKIVGMTYEQHQQMLAAQEAERERIAAIARKEGRVVNVTIKDSVLQRTNLDLGDVGGGKTNVVIEGSVVTKSGFEGETKVKDSVVVGSTGKDGFQADTDAIVGKGPRDGETEEAYEERLAKYEKALKKALADGTITESEKKLLEALRKKFGISEEEHEMIFEMLR